MKSLLAVSLLLFSAALSAQPRVSSRGVVNAASYQTPFVPGGALARGSIFSIFGTFLGSTAGFTLRFPLQTSVNGIQIEITQGAETVRAIPLFSNGQQVNAILPSNTPLGEVQLTVLIGPVRSIAVTVQVVERAVGIFTLASSGFGPGVFQNFSPDAAPVLNTYSTPARPGQTVIAWGVGAGAIPAPDNEQPPVLNLLDDYEITVGGRPVITRRYFGRSFGFAGLDQFIFDVPTDTPEGCYIPVRIRTPNGIVSNSVTMSISRNGSPCSDALNPSVTAALRNGGTAQVGNILLTRSDNELIAPQALSPPAKNQGTSLTRTDSGSATFLRLDQAYFSSGNAFPPVGACHTFTQQLSADGVTRPAPVSLDAGTPILVTRLANGAAGQMARFADATYGAHLGGMSPGGNLPPFLNPGQFRVAFPGATGANSVGPGSATVTIPDLPDWFNRQSIAEIDRTQGATVMWRGGDPAQNLVTIAGASANSTLNLFGFFLCVASADAGQFVIPGDVTANLPASQLIPSQSQRGVLTVGFIPTPSAQVRIPAQGLQDSVLTYQVSIGRNVGFQ